MAADSVYEMLKRLKSGPPPVPPIWRRNKVAPDPWCGDGEAAGLRAALERGDVAPLERAFHQADTDRREFLVSTLTDGLPPLQALESWPEAAPSSALALLCRGRQRVSAAWDARGSGRARTVGKGQWEVFFDGLRQAEQDLYRALDLGAGSTAWSMLLISGRGLQVGTDEHWARYGRATESGGIMAYAADQLLQNLCAKWSGSHEEMFAFARETSAQVPDGDPRHRLVPVAHFERAIDFDRERDQIRYRSDPAVQDEILAAADRSVFFQAEPNTPQRTVSLNWFAFAAGYFYRPDLARPLLEQVGGAPTPWPWNYYPDRAMALLQQYRKEAGLSAVP